MSEEESRPQQISGDGSAVTVADLADDRDLSELAGIRMQGSVFFISAAVIVAFVMVAVIVPNEADRMLSATMNWTLGNFEWLFSLTADVSLLFCLLLIVLPVGSIRLGGADARPVYSKWAWFAMLFACAMGIGFMYWGVAEPMSHYMGFDGTPLGATAETPEAARLAMASTLYHWGLHPWSIYGVVAISLGFFAFNRGLPLAFRSALYPLLGKRVWGLTGDIVDAIAIVVTIFGLSTSIGFGARQISSGLFRLFGVPDSLETQLTIVAVLTLLVVISLVLGLKRGIRRLSQINLIAAASLALFVLVVGPTLAILFTAGNAAVDYVQYIVPLSLWFDRADESWYQHWTIFYWAWWLSWSPFVGLFIARISRGRTIRQCLLTLLVVPGIISFAWMAIFGGSVLDGLQNGVAPLLQLGNQPSLALFTLLETLPLPLVTGVLAITTVALFMVTSADSASLVADSLAAGGALESAAPQRVFWATLQGIIAAMLLVGGGTVALDAVRAAAITTALPFTVVLLLLCVGLASALLKEWRTSTRTG